MINTFNLDHSIHRGRVYVSSAETVTLADSAGANVVSVATEEITWDLSNQKIRLSVEITEVSAGDGGLEVEFQTSVNGTDWMVAAITTLDIDNTALATVTATVDLTGLYSAKWRLNVISDGTDTADACSAELIVNGAMGF